MNDDKDATITIFFAISISVQESSFSITEFEWLQMLHRQCNNNIRAFTWIRQGVLPGCLMIAGRDGGWGFAAGRFGAETTTGS
jgi:hypothetical protein